MLRGKNPSERFTTWFRGLLSRRKRFIEYALVLVLLVTSVFIYISLAKKRVYEPRLSSTSIALSERDLSNGLNQYRLENYERAEILLLKVMESSKRKKIKSTASLYLGNIHFKKANFKVSADHYEKSIFYDRKNVYALHNASLVYAKMGENEKSLEYALKIFKRRERYLPNLIHLGNIYYAIGKYGKAISAYEEGESLEALIKYNLAITYQKMNRTAEARNLLLNIIEDEKVPEIIRGVSFLTISLSGKEEIKNTIENLRKAMEVFPSTPLLRYNLAQELLKTGQYEEAVSLLKSIEGRVKVKEFDKVFGIALFMSGDFQEALEFYLPLYDESKDLTIASIIGDIYVKFGDREKAKEYYSKAIVDPKNEEAFVNLSQIYLEEGAYREALNLCERFIEIKGDDPMPYICIGRVYFEMENPQKARENLEKAIIYSKNDGKILNSIASLYLRYGLFDNALLVYYRILSIDPDFLMAYGKIAEIYYLTGHYDRARKMILKKRERIDDIELYYSLSILLASVENRENALSLYRDLIEEFPYRYEAYQNLSLLYMENGEYENVIKTIEQCFERVFFMSAPIISDLHSILGVAHYQMGHLREASREFYLARELNRNSESPEINLKVMGE